MDHPSTRRLRRRARVRRASRVTVGSVSLSWSLTCTAWTSVRRPASRSPSREPRRGPAGPERAPRPRRLGQLAAPRPARRARAPPRRTRRAPPATSRRAAGRTARRVAQLQPRRASRPSRALRCRVRYTRVPDASMRSSWRSTCSSRGWSTSASTQLEPVLARVERGGEPVVRRQRAEGQERPSPARDRVADQPLELARLVAAPRAAPSALSSFIHSPSPRPAARAPAWGGRRSGRAAGSRACAGSARRSAR